MSEFKTSNPLDYKQYVGARPYYRMNIILPQSGSTVTSLSGAGGNEIIFEIPVSAFNLAQSVMSFDLYLPEAFAPAAV